MNGQGAFRKARAPDYRVHDAARRRRIFYFRLEISMPSMDDDRVEEIEEALHVPEGSRKYS